MSTCETDYGENNSHTPGWPERIATWATRAMGSTWAFIASTGLVIAWVIGGFFIGFDDVVYGLCINTVTTIITFLAVFLIQRSQNKESLAFHLKLNELLAATKGASNSLINVEDKPEREVRDLHALYHDLVREIEEGDLAGARTSIESLKRQEKPSPDKK